MTQPVQSDAHRSLAALGGTPAPAGDSSAWGRFTDSASEARAARSRVVLFDLSVRGELELSGAGKAKFLHGQCTNDVVGLRPGQGCYAAFLTPKGKMIADGDIFAGAERIRLGCEPDVTARLLAHLRKYAVFDQVEIADATADRTLFHLAGPAAADAVANLLGVEPPGPASHFHATAPLPGSESGEIRVARVDRTGLPGFDLSVPAASAPPLLDRLLDDLSIPPAGAEAFRILRVEAGIPRFGEDMDDTCLPDEAGLAPRAISYTKGCYTGQETVARIRTYGHVNRRLVGLLTREIVPVGTALYGGNEAGKPAGRVTSAVVSPLLGRPIALGFLARALAEPGTAVRTADGQAIEVSPLPFVPAGAPS